MSVIYRYSLVIGQTTALDMPAGAQALSVAIKPGHDDVSLWALVTRGGFLQTELRSFSVVGTGWDFDPAGHEFVGTALQGGFVWHVFEVPNAK